MKFLRCSMTVLGLSLCMLIFFGAGCMSVKSDVTVSSTMAGRMHEDGPVTCDIHSPAAPPCTYQTTPDGQFTTFVQAASLSASSSTLEVIVHSTHGQNQIV